jgi:hypothetical protein
MPVPKPINLNDLVPAAPAGGTNVKWQADESDPRNVSAYAYQIPAGGDEGDVLTKASGNDYELEWAPGGGPGAVSPVIGFIIGDGSPGVNVGPMLRPARGGSVSKCVGVIKQSDPNISCRFIIRQNGGSVFAGTPTLSAGAAEGTAIDISPLAPDPLDVLTSDVFSIDIEQGSDLWQFSVQLVE